MNFSCYAGDMHGLPIMFLNDYIPQCNFDFDSFYGVYWRVFYCLLDLCPYIGMRLFFGYLAPGPR